MQFNHFQENSCIHNCMSEGKSHSLEQFLSVSSKEPYKNQTDGFGK